MFKNIPDSCWDNDPSAPWNDIEIICNYTLSINIGDIIFSSEVIKDIITFGYFEIKTPDDRTFIENNLYQIIENNLEEEIKELNYKINLISWTYSCANIL